AYLTMLAPLHEAEANDRCEQSYHRVSACFVVVLDPDQARGLDLPDLVHDEPQTRHIPLQLSQRVRRQQRTLGCQQSRQPLWCFAQGWLETPNAEAGQAALHSVDDAGAGADQVLALTVR